MRLNCGMLIFFLPFLTIININNVYGQQNRVKIALAQIFCLDGDRVQVNSLGMKMIKIPAYGMIHLITSKNAPALHFEFNETWILSDGKIFK